MAVRAARGATKSTPAPERVKGVEAPSTWQIYNDTNKPIDISYNYGYQGFHRSATMAPLRACTH